MYKLQIVSSIIGSMGIIAVGNSVAMTGLMLAQFEEPDSEIKMTVDEGSWFGKGVKPYYYY